MIINNARLNGGEWRLVDKTQQWQYLKDGITANTDRVADVVREMYAVLKTEVSTTLTLDDVWGAHHVLRQDGTLVLNRGGMIEASARIAAGNHDLSAPQLRQAAQHLLRHYRQENVNLLPPQVLVDLVNTGEMSDLQATISGEMRPMDIPLAPGVNIAALKLSDPDPMEVVVEIPSGVSTRKWVYGKVVVRQLADQLMQKAFAGFLGHQKPDDVAHEFPTPVTHWVGALYRDGKVYVRGVIDKSVPDLKRWVRANVINQVSIYGRMTTEERGGQTHVTSIELLSIDWVPLDRAGMATRVVAIGEQNTRGGISVPPEMKELTAEWSLTELFGELRKQGVKPVQLIGELGWDVKTLSKSMGWKLEDVAGEISAEQWAELKKAQQAVGEMAEVYGLSKTSSVQELVSAVRASREAQKMAATLEHGKLVDRVIGEMVPAETARPLVKRMLQIATDADEATVKKTVGELLAADDVKKIIAEMFTSSVFTPSTWTRIAATSNTIKRVSI